MTADLTHPRPAPHDCSPLWVAGAVRATCAEHWWQPVGLTAVADALVEQARHVEVRRVRRHNRAAAAR